MPEQGARGKAATVPPPAPQPLTCGAAEGRVLQLPLPPVQLLRLPVQLLLPLQQLSRGGRGRGLRGEGGTGAPAFPPAPPGALPPPPPAGTCVP